VIYAPTNSKTTEELVPQRLALGDGRETTVLNLLGVELERVFGELETFSNEGGEFTNAAALLAKDLLGVGSTDDDLKFNLSASLFSIQGFSTHLSTGVGDADVAARVTLLGKFAGEELVEFSTEYTIGDELSLLADLAGHFVGLRIQGQHDVHSILLDVGSPCWGRLRR
jgi:hypothetical protein